MNLNILRPEDIEEEIRVALSEYFNAYCPPLPAVYPLPCVLISATGGTTSDTIDTFIVTLSVKAEENSEAYETMSNVLGALETLSQNQVGALRHVTLNSLARWGNDPVRPDLKLCTATVLVTCHRKEITLNTLNGG